MIRKLRIRHFIISFDVSLYWNLTVESPNVTCMTEVENEKSWGRDFSPHTRGPIRLKMPVKYLTKLKYHHYLFKIDQLNNVI